MMVLTGNVGKSVVLQSLINTVNDIYAVVYDESPISTVDALFVSKQQFGIAAFCDTIEKDIRKDGTCKEMIVIYTNLKEADVFSIEDVLEVLEQDRLCRYGIVMCKE